MTPAQLYAAIAAILNINESEAKIFADHLMALTLGRSTTDSTSWRLTPPAQRNDLQTVEKMINRLLNQMQQTLKGTQSAVNGFDTKFHTIVGNTLMDPADDEAFKKIGTNLIKAVADMKTNLDRIIEDGTDDYSTEINSIKERLDILEDIPTYTPSDNDEIVLSSGITATLVQQITEYIENPPQPFRVMTTDEVDELWNRVFKN